MPTSDIGLLGLAVMGSNLARNIASRGFTVSVFNRTESVTKEFVATFGNENLIASYSIEEFIKSIKRPRKVILMVKAGEPVDIVINQILPHLEKGDIVIDGGNSYYKDTIRREKFLKDKGINFVGCGISGGEEGALHGPSLMPGGTSESYLELKPILESIAAKDFDGNPCVTYVAENGAGHFVKMVHNGIEYGVMQILAETYEILRTMYKLEAPAIADVFMKLNQGELKSFLVEISEKILRKKDEFNPGFQIDHILDRAENKGTGKWTSMDALDRGVTLPTITNAVYARYISTLKPLRTKLSSIYKSENNDFKTTITLDEFFPILEQALFVAILICYVQGYDLITTTAQEQNWKINLSEITRIWQGGCIIRADMLKFIRAVYSKNISSELNQASLLEFEEVSSKIEPRVSHLRDLVKSSLMWGIPVPALSSSLDYFNSITKERLSANFIQGLRDFFGAHTYERTDREGIFHTNWEE